MFQIIVNEITGHDALNPVERLKQTVDTLDLLELLNVINRKPRKPRADKGRNKTAEAKP
jgi:hypothetical protein